MGRCNNVETLERGPAGRQACRDYSPREGRQAKVKAHAPHCRVIFTVYEMKRLGRDAAELTALADHLTAHCLVLENARRALPGIYNHRPGQAAVRVLRRDGGSRAGVHPRTDPDRPGHRRGQRQQRRPPARDRRRHARRRPPASDTKESVTAIAKHLGVGRSTLYRTLAAYDKATATTGSRWLTEPCATRTGDGRPAPVPVLRHGPFALSAKGRGRPRCVAVRVETSGHPSSHWYFGGCTPGSAVDCAVLAGCGSVVVQEHLPHCLGGAESAAPRDRSQRQCCGDEEL